MALSRQVKEETVQHLVDDLTQAKMTVFASYSGLSVKQLQDLRAKARENGTQVRVVKNRLVRLALQQVENLKDVDTSGLKGQLIYAINAEDEVAPAQAMHEFAKANPQLEFAGAFNASGELFDADQVRQLAQLPSKDQLRGQLVGTIAAPLTGFVTVMSGNMRGLVNVLQARSKELEA